MKQEKKQETDLPPYDGEKCQIVGGAIATLIAGQVAKSHPQSMVEAMLMITLAMGRVLHVLGAMLDVDPKRICRDFCDSLTKYFELGGDGVVDEVVKTYKQKGN